jgi:adenylate cyclase class IV
VKSSQDEIELKLRVPDPAALRAVAAAAGGQAAAAVRQVNHFFDSEGRALRNNAFGLRLRDEGGLFFLTAKGPSRKGASGALSQRREEEHEISGDEARAILDGEASPLIVLAGHARSEAGRELVRTLESLVGDDGVRYIGAFENRRTRIETRLPTGDVELAVLLELDETTFPGDVIHCEVEMELDASEDAELAERALRALLDRAGVAGAPARGKASRFFAALEGKDIG